MSARYCRCNALLCSWQTMSVLAALSEASASLLITMLSLQQLTSATAGNAHRIRVVAFDTASAGIVAPALIARYDWKNQNMNIFPWLSWVYVLICLLQEQCWLNTTVVPRQTRHLVIGTQRISGHGFSGTQPKRKLKKRVKNEVPNVLQGTRTYFPIPHRAHRGVRTRYRTF